MFKDCKDAHSIKPFWGPSVKMAGAKAASPTRACPWHRLGCAPMSGHSSAGFGLNSRERERGERERDLLDSDTLTSWTCAPRVNDSMDGLRARQQQNSGRTAAEQRQKAGGRSSRTAAEQQQNSGRTAAEQQQNSGRTAAEQQQIAGGRTAAGRSLAFSPRRSASPPPVPAKAPSYVGAETEPPCPTL